MPKFKKNYAIISKKMFLYKCKVQGDILMNSIQAEYLKQAAISGQLGFPGQQPVIFVRTPQAQPDSYKSSNKKGSGGFWLKTAGIVLAVIFRKNIASFAKRNFPNITKDISKAFKNFTKFAKKFKGSDYVSAGWDKYVEYETAAKNFVKDSFSTPSGLTVKKKASDGWKWLTGFILRKK